MNSSEAKVALVAVLLDVAVEVVRALWRRIKKRMKERKNGEETENGSKQVAQRLPSESAERSP